MQTNIYAQLIAVVAAVSSLAVTARSWLKQLDAFAQSGKEFEDQLNASAEAIVNVSTAVKSLEVHWLQFLSKELRNSSDPSYRTIRYPIS